MEAALGVHAAAAPVSAASTTSPRRAVVLLAWGAWAAIVAALGGIVWLDQLLRDEDRADLSALTQDDIGFAVGVFVAATLGALIASRTSHPVSWLLLGLAGSVMLSGLAQAYAGYGAIADPGSLPAARWFAPVAEGSFFLGFGFLALILLLTPTGRPPSRRWSRFVPVIAGGAALWTVATLLSDDGPDAPLDGLDNPMAIDPIQPAVDVLAWLGIAVSHVGVVAAGVSLIRRFRRSDGVERQQLRWVAFAAAIAAAAVVGAFCGALTNQDALLNVSAGLLVTALPVGVGIAIARWRLYDLDRVVSRSLLYTALTAALTAVYVAVVAGLGTFVRTGAVVSGIAAVVAALLVAPLRSLAQRTIDRSMFGRRAEPFTVVSGLNRRLQESASPDIALQVLVDTIATDLRLPFVAVESRDGTPLVTHGDLAGPAGVADVHCTRWPLTDHGESAGVLVLGLRRGEDEFDARERLLLQDLATHAGAAVRSAALVRDLQRARHHLVAAREEERRRLRRDLHDGLGPQLTAVTLKIDAARTMLPGSVDQADAVLDEVRGDVKDALDDIRRLVYGLRPPGLDDLGLLGALRQYAVACAANGTTLEVSAENVEGLSAPVEVAAYRIATEAMTNAVRHAQARHCDVRLACDGALTVEITDDGVGLLPDRPAGVGITSMRERAAELGGTCAVVAAEPRGTRVTARLPISRAEAAP